MFLFVFFFSLQVSDNGIISLDRSFFFWQPSQFPTGNPNIQAANVFAAYWADVDNRVEGESRMHRPSYGTLEQNSKKLYWRSRCDETTFKRCGRSLQGYRIYLKTMMRNQYLWGFWS